MKRYAVIIGAMKAGTTTLFDHLAAHPAVAGSRPKEPGYFAFDDAFARGPDWYHSLFAFDAARHEVALDASTDYAKYPHCGNVPARIKAFGGDFRLIYSLRHPLRRIESHAQHVQHKRREVGQLDTGRANHSLDAGVSAASLDISRYAMQLDQYADYFDSGALMITSVERMATAPENTMASICTHLGIDPALLPATVKRRNAGDQVWRAREVHPLWRAAAGLAPARELARKLVPQTLRDTMRGRTRPATQAEGRFSLRAEEEEMLIGALAPDLVRLRDRYGFDIAGEWGINL